MLTIFNRKFYGRKFMLMSMLVCSSILVFGCGYSHLEQETKGDLSFFDDALPGQPLENPGKNGWNVQEAMDVSEDFRQLPFEPKKEEKERTYLIDRTEQYTLYGSGDYEAMLLEYDGKYAEIHHPYMSNYMEGPQLWEVDADGDGKMEAAIRLNLKHGTDLSVDSFFISEMNQNNELYVHQFLEEDICAQLSEHLTYEITEEGCQPFVDGKKAGPLKKHVEDMEDIKPFHGAGIGDQIHFYEEEGKIEVSAEIGFVAKPVPYMAWHSYNDVTATVSLENGKFILSDFCSKNRGMEENITYTLKEQYGREDLIVTHITYDSSDMNGETLSATARVRISENNFYEEVKLSLRRDEDAYMSGWEIEKIQCEE